MRAPVRPVAATLVALLAAAMLAGCGSPEDREAARVERALSDVVGEHGTVTAKTEQEFLASRSCSVYITLGSSADDDLIVDVLAAMDETLQHSDLATCGPVVLNLDNGQNIDPAGFAPRPREDWSAFVEYLHAAGPDEIWLADPADANVVGGVRWDETGSQGLSEFAAEVDGLTAVAFPDRFGALSYRMSSGPTDWSLFGFEMTQALEAGDQRRDVLEGLADIEHDVLAGRGALFGDFFFEEDQVTANLHIVDFEWYSSVSTTDVKANGLIPGSLAEAGARAIAAYFAENVPAYRLTVKTVDVEILSESRGP